MYSTPPRRHTTPLVLECLPPRLPANSSLAGDWLLAGLFGDAQDSPAEPLQRREPVSERVRFQKESTPHEEVVPMRREVPTTSSVARLAEPHSASASPESGFPVADSPARPAVLEALAATPAHGEQSFPLSNAPQTPPPDTPRGASGSPLNGVMGGGRSGGRGAIQPSQFIAKHYSEALGRLPDPGGWQSSHDYFVENGCNFQSLKTWGRSVYLSPEFNSFPYDNAARLLAAYRGILNREPDEGLYWSWSLLEKGYAWSDVVDTLYDSEEFQGWIPWICNGYSYSFGGTPALWLPPGDNGFQGGSGSDLQAILDRTPAGQTVWLAQKAIVWLNQPLTLPPRVTLATWGSPPHNYYALMGRLVRNADFAEAAVKLRDGARLLNVWVDGARNYVGYRQNAINVQLFGGTGTTVADSVISNTAGWSSLQAFGSAENNPCGSNLLLRNLVTVYSSDHFDGTWADGLSVACENARVENNEIVDATDVPIVLFRSTPAVQRSQIRNNRLLSAGNSAYGGLVADPLRSGQTHDFTGSVVENNVFWTGPNTYYVIGISVGTRAWFGTQADMGHGARFVNNTTGSSYALVNTGIGVSGMLNATVQGNSGQIYPFQTARCPSVLVGASVSAGYASGDLQPYTDVLIQGCIGY